MSRKKAKKYVVMVPVEIVIEDSCPNPDKKLKEIIRSIPNRGWEIGGGWYRYGTKKVTVKALKETLKQVQ